MLFNRLPFALISRVESASPATGSSHAHKLEQAQLVARAFGAWYDVDEASAAFSEGLDPVFVPPAGPGNVPTTSALIVDGLSLLKSGQVQVLEGRVGNGEVGDI